MARGRRVIRYLGSSLLRRSWRILLTSILFRVIWLRSLPRCVRVLGLLVSPLRCRRIIALRLLLICMLGGRGIIARRGGVMNFLLRCGLIHHLDIAVPWRRSMDRPQQSVIQIYSPVRLLQHLHQHPRFRWDPPHMAR
jgi:hypothetical protein